MKKTFKTCNRYFTCILYEDDENFEKYTNNISYKFDEVTYIRHDRDITEDGNLKKPHYHVIFKVGENARWVNSVAEDIQIPPNYLEGCNKDKMLLYLIHANDPDKTQYSIEEVEGELKNHLIELLEKREEEEIRVAWVFSYITANNICSITEITKWCITNKIYDVLRRNQMIIIKLIEEQKYKQKQREERKKNEYKRL